MDRRRGSIGHRRSKLSARSTADPPPGARFSHRGSGRIPTEGISFHVELWVLLGALLVGGALRGYRFTELGLSHFDEGVYALSGLWPWTGTFFPDQAYFSPPLFPLLVGILNWLLGGPSDLSPMAISMVASLATIPVLWWLGRRWFSAGAGLAAAWWGALDGFQISYARVGLTDATFGLLMLLSVGLIAEALEKGGWRWVLLAGVAVGSTWNTKYNGFLPLFLVLGILAGSGDKTKLRRFGAISAIGVMGYLPWALRFHVEQGYSLLLEHQRGYLRGLAGMGDGWRAAFEGAMFFWSPWMALPALLILCLRGGDRWSWVRGGAAGLGMATSGGPAVVVALAGFGVAVPSKHLSRVGKAWLLGWLVVLPAVYTPYLRLWLPTQLFLILFAAGGLAEILAERKGDEKRLATFRRGAFISVLSAGFAAGLAIGLGVPLQRGLPLPQVAEGYRRAGRELAAWQQEHRAEMKGIVRPPLLFYLASHGGTMDRLADDAFAPDLLSGGAALVTDHAREDSPRFLKEYHAREAHFQTVARFHVEPSTVTLLDDYRTQRLPLDLEAYDVRVERLSSP